jgi:hypothetical protein
MNEGVSSVAGGDCFAANGAARNDVVGVLPAQVAVCAMGQLAVTVLVG